MLSFGALKYFGSVIKKLKKIIVPYQPRDLHLCLWCLAVGQVGYSSVVVPWKNMSELASLNLYLPHPTIKDGPFINNDDLFMSYDEWNIFPVTRNWQFNHNHYKGGQMNL